MSLAVFKSGRGTLREPDSGCEASRPYICSHGPGEFSRGRPNSMSIHSKGKGKKAQSPFRSGYRAKAPGVFRAVIIAVFFLLLLSPAFAQVSSLPDAGVASFVTRPAIGFATPQKLSDHYKKHGREFGKITREEYLRLAQTLRDFLACNANGTIRTFFKPNDGEKYFRRQAGRKPNP